MKRSKLFPIFTVVFIDLLGFGLILPLLPYYAEQYGATPFLAGLLVASYAAASLVGAPLFGRLSDRYGRRPILLLSVFGTFLALVLIGLAAPLGEALGALIAPSLADVFVLGFLLFGRVLDGLTAGNITVAQAYISDVTDEKSRARGLGIVGAAFGLGFIIGPAVGGLLSKVSYSTPAFVAAGIAALNLVNIYFALPESLPPERRLSNTQSQKRALSLKALRAALTRPNVGPILYLRLFYGLAFALLQTTFPLFTQAINLSADVTGYLLAYVGVLSVVAQGVLVGPLTRRFKESALIVTGLWVMAFAFVGWAFTHDLVMLVIVLLPLSLAGGLLNTVIQSSLTRAVAPEEVGGVLGIASALESITRVVAPTIGGFLVGTVGTWAPGALAALVLLWSVTFTYKQIVIPRRKLATA